MSSQFKGKKVFRSKKNFKRSNSQRNIKKPIQFGIYRQPRVPTNSSGYKKPSNQTSTRIRGSEIIHTVGVSFGGTPSAIFPVNPRSNPSCVRLYNASRGFQQWRPHFISFEWIPTCPTTSTGYVQLGTVWSSTVPASAVRSALQVSNGGATGAVYSRVRSYVQLRDRLPQNWFFFNDLNEDSNPFYMVLDLNLGSSGYLVLHYDIEFNNPTTQLQTVTSNPAAVGDPFDNEDGTEILLRSALTLTDAGQDKSFDPFTRFIKDTLPDATKVLRNGYNILVKKLATDYSQTPYAKFFRVVLP